VFGHAYQWNIEAASNEEVFIVNRAQVGSQHAPPRPLTLWYRVVVVGRSKHEICKTVVDLSATSAGECHRSVRLIKQPSPEGEGFWVD
jgi:hypothetical protein